MPDSEWGYREDFDEVIEGMSGAVLVFLGRHGVTDHRLSALMAALGVLEVLRDESEPRP